MPDGGNHRDDLFSKSIRAGKRTYFFDVKSTRGNDLYMTITESKRRFTDDGRQQYEKHKLFLYKEDFDKFIEGLQETIDRINALRDSNGVHEDFPAEMHHTNESDESSNTHEDSEETEPKPQFRENAGKDTVYTNISFDDLED